MATLADLKVESRWDQLPLWPHQREAIRVVRKYLKSDSTGSALIRLPTGTGKTGVMAVLAQALDETLTLVIAPWAYLTSQLAREIGERFWLKLGVTPRAQLRPALAFTPATADKTIARAVKEEGVLICTNQTLQQLHASSAPAYHELRRIVSLVLVDEGHREPAPAWGRSVRELEHASVLFTATPYRNDHRFFDVDDQFIFRLPFAEAVAQRFIREVEFVDNKFANNAKAFVDVLVATYTYRKAALQASGGPSPRVIVRCETDVDVRQVAAELRKRGKSVVAVHEEFAGEAQEGDTRAVPDPQTTDAVFWVHQNKLIEGVDDPRFALLAIFQPFSNARALVQQVGRILRNPERKPSRKAFVLANPTHRQKLMWESFKRYEERLGKGGRDVGPEEVFQDLFQLQEEYQYLDGNFRQRFDPTASDFHLHLRYPLSANVFTPKATFSADGLAAAVQEALEEEDYVLTGTTAPDPNTRVFVYARCVASPLLADQTFMELRLGFSIFRITGDYVFHYDTEGVSPDYLHTHSNRVTPSELERLISGSDVRISQVSLLNGDLNLYAVRRRTLSARSIEQLAPGLADPANFCSTTTAVLRTSGGERVRRYVGFTRARVSQPSGGAAEYSDYIAWIDSTATLLNDAATDPADFFNRYAVHVPAPATAIPTHILFDVDDVLDEFTSVNGGDGETLLLEDRAWDVVNGAFVCNAAGTACNVRIRYADGRFELLSPELASVVVERGRLGERRRNLVAYLNLEQSFRIVTEEGYVYAHGQFYKPRLALWGRQLTSRIDLLSVLFTRPALAAITSEKGTAAGTYDGWPVGSVFEFVDSRAPDGLLASVGMNPDILVCDDIGNELADFIAVKLDPPRIALIHGKCGKPTEQLSASAFHEVCSQAVKNLGVLTPQWERKLKSVKIWNGDWRQPATKQQPGLTVRERIRIAPAGMRAAAIWEQIERIARHPSALREVWIVMGHGMSHSSFEAERKKLKPKPSVVQLIYLLQSTWSAVSSVGAVFKVFCKP